MRRSLFLVLSLLLIGGLGVLGSRALATLPPTTIEEAVAITLREAGAPTAVARIAEAGCVPARETCLSYIADVRIDGERKVGRLACATAWRSCTLTMAEFGLRAAPVPDVAIPHPWTLVLNDLVSQTRTWVRELLD